MRIVITDSGLGGLSVAAALYEKLILNNIQGVEIIFANALPDSGKGYNKMPDKATKVRVFNAALTGFYSQFKPNMISVACNTLSVLLDLTEFNSKHSGIISDVVSTGIQGFIESNQVKNNDNMIIFGTETTMDSGVHASQLSSIFQHRICAIPCSGLAASIEKDFQSQETYDLIEQYVKQINFQSTTSKNFVYLACTHYGYVSDVFNKIMSDEGIENIQIIDPNSFLMNDLFVQIKSKNQPDNNSPSTIRIVSRCRILDSEILSISALIQPLSQSSVIALKGYEIIENLFDY